MITVRGVEMLDVREAADLVHRNPETVRRWAWTRRLESVKYGNRLLFRRDDVLRIAGEAGHAGAAVSLADWAERVRATQSTGARGASSRDLVLEDRVARDRGATGAGR